MKSYFTFNCEYSGDVSVFAFEVKFYPPDPAILQEDITRFVISVNNPFSPMS